MLAFSGDQFGSIAYAAFRLVRMTSPVMGSSLPGLKMVSGRPEFRTETVRNVVPGANWQSDLLVSVVVR